MTQLTTLTIALILIGLCSLIADIFKPKSRGPIGDTFLAIGTLFGTLTKIAVIAGLIFIATR